MSMIRIVAGPLAGLGILVALADGHFAAAHDDAFWIEQNPVTKHCCGPNDCHRDEAGIFELLPDGGWRHKPSGRVYRRGNADVYDSRDEEVWWCQPPTSNVPQCVFLPPEIG